MEKRWIWPFELLDKLGEGGMGVVYRARYVVDNRHVAVKLLPPNIANEMILSRFERELEILNTLRHPHIVRCFGGVCEGNQHFYAMELVEGGTLDHLLEERGKFSWEATIQFALQMASGLAYAHERGVVHRDVKPGNFLLTPAGKLKLSDFGLATVEAATKITAAGKTMGTFPYMAPEQIRGRPPVSPQTDLYALGCVIFEMLTGRTPFVGEMPAEVMHKHLDDVPPRISEFASDCPHALESLVRDLLQKDPSDRPESAAIVIERLNDVGPDLEVVPAKARVDSGTRHSHGPAGDPHRRKTANAGPTGAVNGVGDSHDHGPVNRQKMAGPRPGRGFMSFAGVEPSLVGHLADRLSGGGALDPRPSRAISRDCGRGRRNPWANWPVRLPPLPMLWFRPSRTSGRPFGLSAIDGLLAAGTASRPACPELIRFAEPRRKRGRPP